MASRLRAVLKVKCDRLDKYRPTPHQMRLMQTECDQLQMASTGLSCKYRGSRHFDAIGLALPSAPPAERWKGRPWIASVLTCLQMKTLRCFDQITQKPVCPVCLCV